VKSRRKIAKNIAYFCEYFRFRGLATKWALRRLHEKFCIRSVRRLKERQARSAMVTVAHWDTQAMSVAWGRDKRTGDFTLEILKRLGYCKLWLDAPFLSLDLYTDRHIWIRHRVANLGGLRGFDRWSLEDLTRRAEAEFTLQFPDYIDATPPAHRQHQSNARREITRTLHLVYSRAD
jgi:hypothetical protein